MRDDSSSRTRWALRVIFALVWIFAVVAAYFWAHKPFNLTLVSGVGRSLAAVGVWLAVTWLSAALGRRLVGGLLEDDRPAARVVISVGVGLGLLSLLVLVLGLAGVLYPIVAWGLMAALAAVLWRDLGAVYGDLRAIRWPRPSDGFRRWLLFYGGVSLLLTFLVALAPPVAWDTLVYHLTGPRFFVQAGRMVHPVDLPYLGFPQLGEMHFTLGLLLGVERAAPLFHFGYGLLAVAMTALLTRRAFGQRAAWLAATLLLSVPTLLSLMTRAYVDATLMFYATAALYAFLRWREIHQNGESVSQGRRWLALMGLFCGFCGGVKYTAVAIPFALGLSVIWISRREGVRVAVERLALVAASALASVTPGLLENWLTTGNPVYPFFLDRGVYWDAWRGWWYDRPGTGLAATAPWRLLTAPLEAVILGTEGTSLYEATIGPLLLPAAVLLFATWRFLEREERAIVGHLLLFFGVSYILWLNGLARTALLLRARFLFLTFGAVAAMGGVALARLRRLRRPALDLDWIVRAVISLTLALLLVSTVVRFLRISPLPVLLGLESRDGYLTRRLGWHYVVVQDLNERLSSDEAVVFLWETRSYHCRVDCRPDALLDRFLHTTHLYGYDADAIAEAWRAEGFTHVLLHQAGLEAILGAGFDPVTPDDLRVLEELRAEHLTPVEVWGDDVYVLYELIP